jgi:hypothetical protein
MELKQAAWRQDPCLDIRSHRRRHTGRSKRKGKSNLESYKFIMGFTVFNSSGGK